MYLKLHHICTFTKQDNELKKGLSKRKGVVAENVTGEKVRKILCIKFVFGRNKY